MPHPGSTPLSSSAAEDGYKREGQGEVGGGEGGDGRGDVDEVVRQVARCVVEGAGGGELRGRGGHIG